jgi:hypothetical protein
MTDHLDETVKLLMLLQHRAAALDDAGLNRRVDGIVDWYLTHAGSGIASGRDDLARAFALKAPANAASDRIVARIERNGN